METNHPEPGTLGFSQPLCLSGPPTPRLPSLPRGATPIEGTTGAPRAEWQGICPALPCGQSPITQIPRSSFSFQLLSLAQKSSPFFKARLKSYLFLEGFSHPRLPASGIHLSSRCVPLLDSYLVMHSAEGRTGLR